MNCQRCDSRRIATLDAKPGDLCQWQGSGLFLDGYCPGGVGIGRGGDYVRFDYCLDCGQMQGVFPISKEAVENLK